MPPQPSQRRLPPEAPTGSPLHRLQGQYRLHGKINHLGRGPASGHFTADIFDAKSRRWLRHNDSVVTELPAPASGQADSDCYMLVYVDKEMFG